MKFSLFQANALIKTFGLFKVPMLIYTGVSIVELNENRTVVKVPLNWRTKNHLNSMYFGSLAVGADVTAGLYASLLIKELDKKVHLSFKDFNANFLKRSMSDTYFVVENNKEIAEFVNSVVAVPGVRQNLPVNVYATTNANENGERIADFILTLSLKAV